MIRHIVMFSFKPEAEGRTKDANVALTKAMLEQLPSKIGLIRASRVEVNAPGASEENCDLLLISDFDSLNIFNQTEPIALQLRKIFMLEYHKVFILLNLTHQSIHFRKILV